MAKWIYIKLKALAKNIACYNFALFVSPKYLS